MVSAQYIFNKSSQSTEYVLVCDKLPEVMNCGPGLLVCTSFVTSRILAKLSFTPRQSGLSPGTRRRTSTPVSILVGGGLQGAWCKPGA